MPRETRMTFQRATDGGCILLLGGLRIGTIQHEDAPAVADAICGLVNAGRDATQSFAALRSAAAPRDTGDEDAS